MRHARCCVLLSLCLLVAASIGAAQDGDDAGDGKQLRAYRITGEGPRIDGLLTDEVWIAADSIDDFTQQEPDYMAPRERTVVQVAYDESVPVCRCAVLRA